MVILVLNSFLSRESCYCNVLILFSGSAVELELFKHTVLCSFHHRCNASMCVATYLTRQLKYAFYSEVLKKLCFPKCAKIQIGKVKSYSVFQALALIELYNAPAGRYKHDVYLLPKKMGKTPVFSFIRFYILSG